MRKLYNGFLFVFCWILLQISMGYRNNEIESKSVIVIIVKDLFSEQPLDDVLILCKTSEDKDYSSGGITDSIGIARPPAVLTGNLRIKANGPGYVPIMIEIPHLFENDTVTLYLVKVGFKPLR